MMPAPTMAMSVSMVVMVRERSIGGPLRGPQAWAGLCRPNTTMTMRMPQAPFRRLAPEAARVEVVIDGVPRPLPAGEMLAAALLAEGSLAMMRSPKAGEPRGPHCLMGSCFQCTATIDGVPLQRTCRATVRAGMRVDLGR